MNFLTNHKKLALLIASILCVVSIFFSLGNIQPTFITNLTSRIIVPSQKLTNNIGNWVSDRLNFINNFRQIELENIDLVTENERLRSENTRMQLLEQDNILLRELLQMDQKYPEFSTIGAEIVARDSNNWNSSFIIDKGTNHDLQPNMVVLAQGGLVGRIFQVGTNFSRVIPIIDESSSVGSVTLRTNDFGIVKGNITSNFEGTVRMELLSLDSDILEGDEIITSSLSEIYPPGITIGYVTEIQDDPSTLMRTAIIEPTVDFNRITTVLVINQIFDIDFEY